MDDVDDGSTPMMRIERWWSPMVLPAWLRPTVIG